MKVGIVTVHNSHNCGSYLQAEALRTFIKELGYDARFVKNKIHPQSKLSYKLMMSFKYYLKGQFKKATAIAKSGFLFRKARKNFTYFKSFEGPEACVFGSDTIWNMESVHLTSQWEHYFGKKFNGKKIAYAPSIGPSTVESVTEKENLCSCLKDFDFFSVRDENTYKVVSTVVGDNADITYVVDPTMLMPKPFYEGIASECNDENFILFYYFGIPDKAYMDEIKKYAKEKGKKIICFGDNISQADKNIPFTPLEMMAYYSKADLIITNTFHGNVFSLIFNKPFVNIDAGKAKVDDLLKSFDLSMRTAYSADDFERISNESVDFEAVNEMLAEMRKMSGEYLENALRKCEGGLEK